MNTLWKVCVTLGVVGALVLLVVYINGGINVNNDYTKKYSSLESAKESLNFELEVPNYVEREVELAGGNNREITTVLGDIIYVKTADMMFSASLTEYNDLDVFGLYDTSYDIDEHYINSESGETIRYRQNYQETIITWSNGGVLYGIRVNTQNSVEDMCELADLDFGEYKVYNDIDDGDDYADDKGDTENKNDLDLLDETHSFELGQTVTIDGAGKEFEITNGIDLVDNGEAFIGSIDSELVVVIAYDNLDYYRENYYKYSEIDTKTFENDGICFIYLSDNPFSSDTEQYKIYSDFLENIDNIRESIRDIDG